MSFSPPLFFGPENLTRIDLVGDSLGALISFLIAYYAHKGYKLSQRRSLFLLYSGFLVIGIGLLVQGALIGLLSILPQSPLGPGNTFDLSFFLGRLFAYSNVAHWIIGGIGYLLVLSAYLTESKLRLSSNTSMLMAPIAIPFLLISPFFELATFAILVAILTQVVLIYISGRSRSTLYVVVGFLLLTLAHLSFILFPSSGYDLSVYELGHGFQISGFLLLLFALTRKSPGTS